MRIALKDISTYRTQLLNWPILGSLLFVMAALIFDTAVGRYADAVAVGAPLGDLILDRIPVIDTRFLTSYGFEFIMLIYFLYPALFLPEKFSYVLKQTALLIILRNITIVLTHLPAPAGFLPDAHSPLFADFVFDHDLLFSGHTAFPFLAFLLYHYRRARWFFLVASFVMAAAVLGSHSHYSVDVWAAFFFAYGSYKLGMYLFGEPRNALEASTNTA